MRRLKLPVRKWTLTTILMVFFVCGSSLAVSSIRGAHASNCSVIDCGAWSIVDSPDPAHYYNNLSGVAFLSPTNVWAVGTMGDFYHSQFAFRTLIEHWNGSNWNVFASPNIGPYDNSLQKISAISANDMWAVGSHSTDNVRRGLANRILVEHWNGSVWSVVRAANPGPYMNGFSGVAAVSRSDIWAVGQYQAAGSSRTLTLIERWDGAQWRVIPSPNPGRVSNTLADVVALSANNIWAAGTYNNDNAHDRTLIEHWNGTQWSVVASPNASNFSNDLLSISAVAANDIWTVGCHYAYPGNVNDALIEHWNGSNWSVVNHPEPGLDDNFQGVFALSKKNVWAVGSSDYSHNVIKPLIEQWDGKQWSMVQAPSPSWSSFLAITASSSGQVWSVGYRATHQNSYTRTLTEHYRP